MMSSWPHGSEGAEVFILLPPVIKVFILHVCAD